MQYGSGMNSPKIVNKNLFGPRHDKTGFLPRRKQRRRSASR